MNGDRLQTSVIFAALLFCHISTVPVRRRKGVHLKCSSSSREKSKIVDAYYGRSMMS